MNEPKWVRRNAVLAIHDRQIELFGGQYGLRDAGLLNSALSLAKNFYFYENADKALESSMATNKSGSLNRTFKILFKEPHRTLHLGMKCIQIYRACLINDH